MNPYVIFLAAFALWYVPGALALYKMEYSLKDFSVVAIRETYIDVRLNLLIKNLTKVDLNIQSIDVSVYLNGDYVSDFITSNIILKGASTETVGAIVRLKNDQLGTSLWKLILDTNFQNAVFTFQGIARANGRPYPFKCNMTVKEIIEYYG